MIWFGIFSLLVVLAHAAWKWAGAGGMSYIGTIGTLGPAYFGAILLWPTFAISCVCVGIILFRPGAPERSKAIAFFFLPIIIYGIYFLIVGGSGERAGIR
jgi:hypothetical protein